MIYFEKIWKETQMCSIVCLLPGCVMWFGERIFFDGGTAAKEFSMWEWVSIFIKSDRQFYENPNVFQTKFLKIY